MIHIEELSYLKNGRALIDSCSADFRPSKIYGILGPNGSGKSTLLNCISGILPASTGRICWEGTNVNVIPAAMQAKRRAYLTQQQALAFPLTVREVIEMGRFPFYSTTPSAFDSRIVEEMIELFQLNHFVNRTYQTLSGGEKQRVQFARVFAQAYTTQADEGKILLLDEPLSHLDISHQFEFLELAQSFTKQHKLITLCVLHDLHLAHTYTDYLLVMNQGKIVLANETSEVIGHPLTSTVFQTDIEIHHNGNQSHVLIAKPSKT